MLGVAAELRVPRGHFELLVDRHVGSIELRRGTRGAALPLELRLEAVAVQAHTLVGRDFLDHLDRDPVRVVETEDGFPGQARFPALAGPAGRLAHAVDPLRERPREALLLREKNFRDPLRDRFCVLRLDVDAAVQVDDGGG